LAKAQALADEIKTGGGQAEAIAFDVTDADAAAPHSKHSLPTPDPGAGEQRRHPRRCRLPRHERGAVHSVLDVSLSGFFNVTQPLTLPMLRSRWGRIVNITSIAGLTGNRGQVNYAAARARCTPPPSRCR